MGQNAKECQQQLSTFSQQSIITR